MFLTTRNGGDGRLRFAITTGGGDAEQRINTSATLAVGVWHHVAVTVNGNTGTVYLDGSAVGSTNNISLRPSGLGSTVTNFLGRSQYSDPYLNGALDEFRIYSVALSAEEVAATHSLGPNQLLSTDSPPVTIVLESTTLAMAWPLAAAGYTVQTRTNLISGNWVDVGSPAPQIVGGQWLVTLPVALDMPATFFRLAR